MKISLATLGTRGDVQPFLALAIALQARGHEVRLAAPENCRSWIGEHGIRFDSLGVDIEALIQSPEVKSVLAGRWWKIFSLLRETILPMVKATLNGTLASAREADVIIFHPKVAGATDVAEKTGAIAICASLQPMVPTNEFPLWAFWGDFGPPLNRATWNLLRVARAPYAHLLNKWRKETLGLGKGKTFELIGAPPDGCALHLCAISPSVVPKPFDWNEHTHMVGYWFLNEVGGKLDPLIQEFLSAGEPPIYVGLGSMPVTQPEQLAKQFIDAARGAGCRLVISKGWGGLKAATDTKDVLMIDSVPHDLLFPHVRAVIHHGGAGTTAAGLRAGRPTLVFPQVGDQHYWANKVEALGCGPPRLRRGKTDVSTLVDRMKDLVHTESYRLRAQSIAAAIAQEDGVANAVALIEAEVAGPGSSGCS